MSAESTLQKDIIDIYDKRAATYDFTANLYYLIGYPEWKYRRMAIDALRLKPGDTIVEIGCGTGLNFELLERTVGPEGRIIGVDLTEAMLQQAHQRVKEQGWKNVELIHEDALRYEFPERVNGVISTFAISLIPGAANIVQHASEALASKGRMALLDLQMPTTWPGWLKRAAMTLVQPFAVTDEWSLRHPWMRIQEAMREHLIGVEYQEMYLKTTYLISGEART